MQSLEVSWAVRDIYIYIYDISRLRVKILSNIIFTSMPTILRGLLTTAVKQLGICNTFQFHRMRSVPCACDFPYGFTTYHCLIPVVSGEHKTRVCHLLIYILFIFYWIRIFTVCFKEALSRFDERFHYEGRCCPLTVLRVQVILLADLWS